MVRELDRVVHAGRVVCEVRAVDFGHTTWACGCACFACVPPCTGAEAAQFVASGTDVDIMLLDIRMPGKSGIDVVREAAVKPRYPIVAMTGHVDIEAQEEFR